VSGRVYHVQGSRSVSVLYVKTQLNVKIYGLEPQREHSVPHINIRQIKLTAGNGQCLFLEPVHVHCVLRGPFEKFVDSPYYLESELYGGAVTVSFSKYLPWQAMHLLQRSTHFSKTCCRPFAASFRRIVEQAVFLPRSCLFMIGKAQKSHGGEIWTP
jgi:hypothetical protein